MALNSWLHTRHFKIILMGNGRSGLILMDLLMVNITVDNNRQIKYTYRKYKSVSKWNFKNIFFQLQALWQ